MGKIIPTRYPSEVFDLVWHYVPRARTATVADILDFDLDELCLLFHMKQSLKGTPLHWNRRMEILDYLRNLNEDAPELQGRCEQARTLLLALSRLLELTYPRGASHDYSN